MKRIMLTGARAPVTLDLARQFHRAGHEVFLVDSIRLPLAWPTRAAIRTLRVSRPAQNPAQFVDDLMQLVRRFRIDLLIPTCEEIFFLAARLDAFSGLTNVFAEPLERLSPLHSKWQFVELIRSMGTTIQAPETRLLTDAADVARLLSHEDSHAWVFKPVFSRFAARTRIGPSLSQMDSVTPNAADPWVAQRMIRGQEYSTYSVAIRGKLRAHACYRSEYRAGPGSGIYFVNQDRAAIRQFVEQFVANYQFTGQVGFDLIAGEDGITYVLECNPRATSGLHMLDGEPLADAFLDEDGPLLQAQSSQPKMLGSIMFLYALPEAVRRWRFGKFCRDMVRARDVMFRWDDPLPALLAPLSLVEVIATALRTRKVLTAASTFDIEWNGEPL